MKQVLLFNLEKQTDLKKLFALLNIKTIDVLKKDQNQKIGYLLNKTSFVKKNGDCLNSFLDKMIVFDEFDDNSLNEILKLLRQSSIQIPLKSIVTDHNIDWDAISLRNELMKEHQIFLNKAKDRK